MDIMQKQDFEPKILGFFCNWCCYAGADLAGVSRFQYPPNLRIIRMTCSAMVNPMYIMKALLSGIDGVFIGGCHIGDCHYIKGNYYARRRATMLKKVLEVIGLEPQRLRVEWISAAEGAIFAEAARDFTQTVRSLGPNPLKLKSKET